MRVRRGFAQGLIAAMLLAAAGVGAAAVLLRLRTKPDDVHLVLPPPDEAADTPIASPAFAFLDRPRDLPDLHFVDAAGRAHALAELRGHPLVLNVWATWCVPCRKEMPTLDHLQTMLARTDALVVPLSIDSKGPSVVTAFYREIGIRALGVYVDSSGTTATALAAVGVPTTLLVDRDGREIGRKLGAAVWDSPEMVDTVMRRLDPRAVARP